MTYVIMIKKNPKAINTCFDSVTIVKPSMRLETVIGKQREASSINSSEKGTRSEALSGDPYSNGRKT